MHEYIAGGVIMIDRDLVVVRGGGDLATGTICRLQQSGYKVLVLEIEQPTVIRRTVSVAQAIFTKKAEIERIQAVYAASPQHALELASRGVIPVIIDPEGHTIEDVNPYVVVDAILAKKNMGTKIEWAPIVIGLGPGFTAGRDVHAVVETKRGHHLGRVYYQGEALPNTGIPGDVGGASIERVVRALAGGSFIPLREIGDWVKKGDILGYVEGIQVKAPLQGVLRGIINEGIVVTPGMKIGDVDPRQVTDYCWSISDKARAIGGGVLEAINHLTRYNF